MIVYPVYNKYRSTLENKKTELFLRIILVVGSVFVLFSWGQVCDGARFVNEVVIYILLLCCGSSYHPIYYYIRTSSSLSPSNS